MKYLLIFLPIFCFAQGGDSTLYGVRNDAMFITGENINGFDARYSGFYVSDRKSKVVESFKYLGAYYELRENGWYKEIDTLPDLSEYLNGYIKLENGTMYRFQPPVWKTCDQHIGKIESYQREKIDTSEVKLLVWTGCSLAEVKATKHLLYNEMQVAKNTGGLAVYITETIKVDVVARYVSDGNWIKSSHIIKEL